VLKVSAAFPNPGATAYVSPHGEAVRIIQANADGSYIVARQRHPAMYGSASDTYRAEPDAIHATEEAAIGLKPRRKRRAA
jgi:hypothetical protein